MYVKANRVGDVEQLDYVNAAAAAFDRGDHGLVSTEPLRKLRLTEAGALALLDQNIDEAHLSW